MPESKSTIFLQNTSGSCFWHSILKTTPTELCQISLPFSNFEDFKHIFKLVKVALIMSVINASPECGASAVERIKTRMQSKTKVDLFNALLMILLNEPSLNNIDEVKELIN